MKTSELTGSALDWAVAKCVNPTYGMVQTHQDSKDRWHVKLHGEIGNYAPSTNWAQGGPIIDQENITVCPVFAVGNPEADAYRKVGWVAHAAPKTPLTVQRRTAAPVTTPLVAAMRCFVASKLGDEVEIPEELT